jgi:hypothetical protein
LTRASVLVILLPEGPYRETGFPEELVDASVGEAIAAEEDE